MRTSWSRRAVVVVAVATLATAGSSAAVAQFRDTAASAGLPVSTAQLAPPTGLKASAGCVLLTHKVDLQWKATTSSFASGYRIRRAPAGSTTYSLIATVSGVSTTTYTDSPLSSATSYAYVVDAYRGGWSATTAAVTVTTRSLCVL